MQITSAMKMVSASKLRRAQDAILQLRPYAAKLSDIMSNVSGSISESEGVYTTKRERSNLLIVTVSSNRGLCGAFNSNVIKRTRSIISEHQESSQITVLSIGKKSEDYFKKTDYGIIGTTLPKNLSSVFDNLNFETVSDAAEKIMSAYATKQFDEVILVYNQFKNAAVQNVMAEPFLPILPPEDPEKSTNSDYLFEPEQEVIVNELIPKSLKIQLYKAVLDSYAAEHGARMTSMHKATDNANELIKELKLVYNKARQASITGEILEIVAGAEALK
jgi:F-type H+-transporting ATPase subunit gamma